MTSKKEQLYIRRIAELEAKLKRRDERISALGKQVAELMEQVGKLTDKVAKLSKNSSNGYSTINGETNSHMIQEKESAKNGGTFTTGSSAVILKDQTWFSTLNVLAFETHNIKLNAHECLYYQRLLAYSASCAQKKQKLDSITKNRFSEESLNDILPHERLLFKFVSQRREYLSSYSICF